MPTTNPVPSTDPSDLLFNAGKLDEVLNGTGTSFTDRLGTARRTVAGMNADFDAQLADAESDLNVYRDDAAASAAQALGYLNTIRTTSYGAYSSDPATDPLGNPPNVGDEYFNTTSNLLKRFNGTTWQSSDINTANLAAPSGSSLVGYDTGTVQDVLDAVTGPNGAALVGYIPAGTGAVATTVQSKLMETVSVFDFLPADQVTLIQAKNTASQNATVVTAAIHAAIATGKKVFFPEGAYLHTGISVGIATNQVHLEGAGWARTRLYCTTASAHSILIKNTGTVGQFYTFPTIKNLHIDGNDANGCGIYGDGIVWYCFEDLRITNQGSHGIYITDTGTPSGGSYLGVIRNVYCSGNVGDGLYQVATKGDDQQNASWISNCEFQGNANGATVWGASINITNSALEGNTGYGLRILTTNTGTPYPAQRLSVKDNYFENNLSGHIYVKTRSSSGLIEGLSIDDNYYFSPNNLVTYVAVQFDCGTDLNEVRGLSFKGNQFLFTTTPNVVADFDNGLANDCVVAPRFQLNGTPEFNVTGTYINFGQARFERIKSQTLSGYFLSKGNTNITYSATSKSDNITANGSAKFPLSIPSGSSLVQFSVPVETDSTNYTVQFILHVKSVDGTAAHAQSFNIPISANSGSKTVKTAVLIAYGGVRVAPVNADMYLQVSVSFTTPGAFCYLGNPTIYYV